MKTLSSPVSTHRLIHSRLICLVTPLLRGVGGFSRLDQETPLSRRTSSTSPLIRWVTRTSRVSSPISPVKLSSCHSVKLSHGFTLVELMIVIAIIWVLAASLFPMMSGYMARSRDTARTADIRSLHTAITSYYNDTGSYPTTPSTLVSTRVITSTGSEWTSDLKSKIGLLLGNKMPSDPVNGQSYSYGYLGYDPQAKAGMNYMIGVNYEKTTGPYCPMGFIRVPGSDTFSTSDFCVAKYEMTYSDADTPDSTGGGTDWNTTHYNSSKTPVSMPGKYPIGDINQVQALAECQKIGAHLITNNEWMTIARNIEANPKNWSTGVVGAGFIPNGVSGDTTLGCDSKGGNTESRTYGTKTGPSGNTCDQRRALTLSNGETLYDLAGNVWEQVNRSNNTSASTATDIQWAGDLCSTSNYWHTSAYCTAQRATNGPLTPSSGTNQGMGYVWNNSGSDKVFLRGATAGPGGGAGLFALDLDWTPSYAGGAVGFRCAR